MPPGSSYSRTIYLFNKASRTVMDWPVSFPDSCAVASPTHMMELEMEFKGVNLRFNVCMKLGPLPVERRACRKR